jgi:hypothetical protein
VILALDKLSLQLIKMTININTIHNEILNQDAMHLEDKEESSFIQIWTQQVMSKTG